MTPATRPDILPAPSRPAHVPPGPPRSFALAMVLRRLMGRNVDRLALLSEVRQYGDIAFFALKPGMYAYLLMHPDMVKYVLVDASDKFHKGPMFKTQAEPVLGKGLLLSEDEFHKRQRKLAQPAFHHLRVVAYGDVMVRYTERLTERWQPGQQVDIHHEMMRLTMEIVAKTLFDADVSDDAESIGEAITEAIHRLNERMVSPVNLPTWIPTKKQGRAEAAAATLEKAVMSFIKERRASGEDKGDLLSMLLLAVDEDDGGQMTNKQVRDEAMTLFTAGHETTANALTWAFYLLAQHPDTFARLTAELDSVLAGRAPTPKDLANLPITDQVIKEAMRLYPPAWIINRQAMEEVQIGGYLVPKGALIFVSPYLMHRDARFFPEPESFQPERWTPEFEKALPKYAYFPFGGGPRVCIGQQFALMEARLILAAVAKDWRLSLVPDQQIEIEPMVTLRAKHGIRVLLERR